MSKRAKNGSAPRYFDADYKTSYQKLKESYDSLFEQNARMRSANRRVIDAADKLMQSALAVNTLWKEQDMDVYYSFSNDMNAYQLNLEQALMDAGRALLLDPSPGKPSNALDALDDTRRKP